MVSHWLGPVPGSNQGQASSFPRGYSSSGRSGPVGPSGSRKRMGDGGEMPDWDLAGTRILDGEKAR
jgi:hypothetical protein